MDNILDHVVVQGQRYDIVSPTAFGDYIETIGSACINPDGYAKGSTFLARLGNEQFYYEATAAITQGSAISEGTNCKKTTVTGREAELAEYVDSLNEALSNYAEDINSVISANGAVNLLPNNATSQVITGVTFTVNSDGTVTANAPSGATDASLFAVSTKTYSKGTYRLSGCPSGGSLYNTYLVEAVVNGTQYFDYGNGIEFTLDTDSSVSVNIIVYQPIGAFSNVVFKPMITLASQPDSDYAHYVPYAMTNRELTEHILKSTLGTAKNFVADEEYTAPSDGYLTLYTAAAGGVSNQAIALIGGKFSFAAGGDTLNTNSIYIRKGLTIKATLLTGTSAITFYPFT